MDGLGLGFGVRDAVRGGVGVGVSVGIALAEERTGVGDIGDEGADGDNRRNSAADRGIARSGTVVSRIGRSPNQATATPSPVPTSQATSSRQIRMPTSCQSRYGADMPMVLLVEDDETVRGALTHALTDAGNAVRSVGRAFDALREISECEPDLVILDLGLPDLDGVDALRMLRAVCDVPVIVATARSGDTDVVSLLNAGADDYVTKPFSTSQLAARISAVLRRGRPKPTTPARHDPIHIGALHINPDRRAARLGDRELGLTRKEFDLLLYLANQVGRVVSRRELITEVWQQPYIGAEQTIDVHISWLRRKLGESAANPRYLRTVRGVGVMLVAPE